MLELSDVQYEILKTLAAYEDAGYMINRPIESDPPEMILERTKRNEDVDKLVDAGLVYQIDCDFAREATRKCGHEIRIFRITDLGRVFASDSAVN